MSAVTTYDGKPKDFSVNDMKPTARAVKDQEMAIRRAYELNAGLIEELGNHKNLEELIDYHRSAILNNKRLKALFPYPTYTYRHKDVWEWIVRHWYSGALRQSVIDSMSNITDTNKAAIRKIVEKQYGDGELHG